MNKHLKPGVAVDVRGASDEDMRAVIDACKKYGASRNPVHGSKRGEFVLWDCENDVWICHEGSEDYPVISISQALGRDSEVENTWVSGVECEASYAGKWYRAKFLSLHETNPHAYAVYVLDSEIDGRNLQWVTKLRPLKTEKEKFVERAKKEFPGFNDGFYSKMYELVRFIDVKA